MQRCEVFDGKHLRRCGSKGCDDFEIAFHSLLFIATRRGITARLGALSSLNTGLAAEGKRSETRMRSSRLNLSKPLSPIAIKPAAISANPAVTMIRVVINCVRQARRKSKRYGQAIRHSNDDVADGFGACEVAIRCGVSSLPARPPRLLPLRCLL